jgi:hypothetical protein
MAEPPLWFMIVQAGSYLFAAGAAGVAGAKYVLDRNAARRAEANELESKRLTAELRQEANAIAERDLAWRKMEAAQKMLDRMGEDPYYDFATTILDWGNREYEVGGKKIIIDHRKMLSALRVDSGGFDQVEVEIRDAFDRLFYLLERTQRHIALGLLDIDHVRFPLAYYAKKIAENRAVIYRYLDRYGFTGARELIEALLCSEDQPSFGK